MNKNDELLNALMEIYGEGGTWADDLGGDEDGASRVSPPVENGDEVGMLTYIPLDQLHAHPDNPRKELGDLSELAESIKAKGVMQNLTVVPRAEGGYTVIIGHRRSEASRIAGLERVPCVIVEMSEREQVATMLLENMQRVDLTAFEQAQGFQMMMDLGDTVEGIAEKTGFSKRTVRGRLKMAELDRDTFRRVSSERQLSIGDLEKLGQIEDIKKRNELLSVCGTNNFDMEYKRKLTEQEVNKAMPHVQAAVKALQAKKIERSETWSGKYTTIVERKIADFKEGDSIEIPQKYASEKLFYCINTFSNDVTVYALKPNEAPVKRSKEEIEREKDIKDVRSRLDMLCAEAYELRYDFVKGLKVTKANESAMVKGALMALICEQHYYSTHVNKREIYEDIGGVPKFEDYYTDKIFDKVVHYFNADEKHMIPSIIYASFGDGASEKTYSTYTGEYPRHQKNNRINALYDWLVSCGYEMSDDEIGLRDGTHEIFKRGAK